MLSVISAARTSADAPQMGTWREGGRNSAPQPPPATAAAGRCPAPAAPPASHGRPGSAWRSAGTHPSTRPSPCAAATRLQREQPRAGGQASRDRGLAPPWPPARGSGGGAAPGPCYLRGAGLAGVASPAAAERGRGRAGSRHSRALTCAPPPPPASSAAGPHQLPPPHGHGGEARSCSAAAAALPLRPWRWLEGTSGKRLLAGPRLRLSAVSGPSSVSLPPKVRPHGLARWCPAGGRAGEGGEEQVRDGGGGKRLLREGLDAAW